MEAEAVMAGAAAAGAAGHGRVTRLLFTTLGRVRGGADDGRTNGEGNRTRLQRRTALGSRKEGSHSLSDQ